MSSGDEAKIVLPLFGRWLLGFESPCVANACAHTGVPDLAQLRHFRHDGARCISVLTGSMIATPISSILFICLGNICRSPLAQAAFEQEAARVGLAVTADSAGTGNWHVGHAPDPRAQAVALRNGVDIGQYQARQIVVEDFRRFDMIFALDAENLANLRRRAPSDSKARLSLLLDLVPGRQGQAVADPYYGDDAGFDVTWSDVAQAANALVARLQSARA